MAIPSLIAGFFLSLQLIFPVGTRQYVKNMRFVDRGPPNRASLPISKQEINEVCPTRIGTLMRIMLVFDQSVYRVRHVLGGKNDGSGRELKAPFKRNL